MSEYKIPLERKILGFVVTLLTSMVIISFVPALARAVEKGSLRIGEPPPKITLPDLNRYNVTIPDDFKGKVVIIHFWAVWCRQCLEELSTLESLYTNYKRKGLIIVAINVGQSEEEVRSFVKKVKITYSVFLDPVRKVAKKYGVSGLPKTFILERDGLIKYKIYGEATEDKLKKLVLSIL